MKKIISILFLLLFCGNVLACDCFVRGDIDGDGDVDWADLSKFEDYLDDEPGPYNDNIDSFDTNDDGYVNLSDYVYLNGMLLNIYSPNEPCTDGLDPTPDALNEDCDYPEGEEDIVVLLYDSDWGTAPSGWTVWPFEADTYSCWLDSDGTWYGGQGAVHTSGTSATDYKSDYSFMIDRDGQDIAFDCGVFRADCSSRNPMYIIPYKSILKILPGTAMTGTTGWIILECDLSEAIVSVTFTNTTTSATTTAYIPTDLGIIGCAIKHTSTGIELDPANWDAGWDNACPGRYEVPYQIGEEFLGDIVITSADLRLIIPSTWDDDDEIEITTLGVSDMYPVYDDKFGTDPTGGDYIQWWVGFDNIVLSTEE